MKKALSIILSLTLIICIFSACSKTNYTFEQTNIDSSTDIAIVTFNCAAPWGNLLDGTSSSKRVKRFASYMNAIHPDSIGTQEMNQKWLNKLEKLMSDYDSYGVVRGGDENENKSEMNAIFWLKDKYDCIEQGTFWLSETPNTESKYEGAGCNRICSYVVLQNKETGEKYIHLNTHLDNASDDARKFGANVILNKIDELQSKDEYKDIKIVLTGDFNDTIDSTPYNVISQKLNDTRFTNKSVVDDNINSSTYHDWGNLEDSSQPIDFIFSNSSSTDFKLLNDISNGYVSDHYGVYAVVV